MAKSLDMKLPSDIQVDGFYFYKQDNFYNNPKNYIADGVQLNAQKTAILETNFLNALKQLKKVDILVNISSTPAGTALRNEFKCKYFNTRNTINMIEELKLYTKHANSGVVGQTETWLYKDMVRTEFNISD